MNNLCLSERKGFSPLFMPCFIFKKKVFSCPSQIIYVRIYFLHLCITKRGVLLDVFVPKIVYLLMYM